MKKTKIYTRKGDFGETGLFDGTRVPKNDALIEAIGAVDELNAQIGVVIAQIQDTRLKIQVKKLEEIQGDLFAIGAGLAGYKSEGLEKRVKEMEGEIDEMWGEMPPLKNFILPRGQLHLARAVCRRAERAIVAVRRKRLADSIKYLNRLSDYLFVLARWVNYKEGQEEMVWRNRGK